LELFKVVFPKRVRIRGDWSEEKSNLFSSYLMQKLLFFPFIQSKKSGKENEYDEKEYC
jgi:hypothetical protein